jgi:hypothetical protein
MLITRNTNMKTNMSSSLKELLTQNRKCNPAWYCRSIIPALRRLRQEDYLSPQVQDQLGQQALKKKKKEKQETQVNIQHHNSVKEVHVGPIHT